MFRRRPPRLASSAEVVPLSRTQLLGVLAGLILVGGVLLYGLGYTLVSSFSEGSAPDGVLSSAHAEADPAQRRDLIAAGPMATVAQDAGLTPGVAIALPPAIRLPAATTVGVSGVSSGFPRTPEGAAAQLARQSYLGVTSGVAQIKGYEAAVASTTSSLESNKLGYQVGVKINKDVLDAQSKLADAAQKLAKARYDTILAQVKLKQAVGVLSLKDLEEINALLDR